LKGDMKIRKYDGTMVDRIITAAITNTEFLRRLRPIWKPELSEGDLERLVLGWCFDFLETHDEAPGQSITDVFGAHEAKLRPEQSQDVGDFLTRLSKKWESGQIDGYNVDHLLARAGERYRDTALRRLAEDIVTELDNGDLPMAEARLTEHRTIVTASSGSCDPFADDAIAAAWGQRAESLVTYPGPLGQLLNPQLTRDSFVALLGREKISKTWRLVDLAFRAIRSGRRVLFCQLGDLSQAQQIMRFAVRMAGRSNRERYCGDILVPILDCWHNQCGTCELGTAPDQDILVDAGDEGGAPDRWTAKVPAFDQAEDHEVCTACAGRQQFLGSSWWKQEHVKVLTEPEARFKAARFRRAFGDRLRLFCRPAGTAKVSGIDAEIERLSHEEDFVPDLVVVDYADLVAPENSREQFRHQQDQVWKDLRAMAGLRSCCVVTATQADAASYSARTVGMKNFSEDKRKLAHVTAMFGLNQMPQEQKRGIIRINPVVVREDEFESSRCVHVLQALQKGRPFLGSYW
jgi:hypothetical protein